jgi:hypothetical protein
MGFFMTLPSTAITGPVAIKAAGFPVALVHMTRYDGPWEFPPPEWQPQPLAAPVSDALPELVGHSQRILTR